MKRIKNLHDISSVNDIYERDPQRVVGIAYKFKVGTRTIELWNRCGIPEKYWPLLDEHYGVPPICCFKINAKIKGYRA